MPAASSLLNARPVTDEDSRCDEPGRPAMAGSLILSRATTRRRVGEVVRRIVGLISMLCGLAGFAGAPGDSRILFAAGTPVPRSVQLFAWRVIETRCNYQSYER